MPRRRLCLNFSGYSVLEMASLTVQDAARAMGISSDTVRRRIRSGMLAAERQPTPQGYQWLVDVREELLDRSSGGDRREAEIRHLEQTVQELRESLTQARDELRARRTEVRQLIHLVESLQSRNPAGAGIEVAPDEPRRPGSDRKGASNKP